MKYITYKYITCLMLVCFTLTGCSQWLDVNDNPNTTEEVDAKYLFNYAAVRWSGDRLSGNTYIPVALATQIQADGGPDVFKASKYEMPTERLQIWYNRYSIVANNLQLALETLKNEPTPQPNAEAQCKILLAMQIYEITTLFGDAPFSESWNNNIKYPKFDKQEDILNGVIHMLDEAIDLINPDDTRCIDDYDNYFSGDMNKWKAIAHSLKFRTLMVMVDADPSKAAEISRMMTANDMISSAANNMEFKYFDKAGNQNPKYRFSASYGRNMILAHNSVLKPMLQYNDSRIPQYFTSKSGGTYIGLDTQETYSPTASIIGAYLYRADCPDLIYSYQEQLLLEAEVYARGIGVTQDLRKANTLYKAGVQAACDYYEADAAATATFIAGLPDLSTLTPEKALYEIHLQQWIDLMDRPSEAFVQWRRSGPKGSEVPNLQVPPQNSHPGVMRRWQYPEWESNSNPNVPANIPEVWEAMWFDL